MSNKNDEPKVLKIRPAGRHLSTIGRDLIKDDYAAIVELVKNAYDADANKVEISIYPSDNNKGIIIKISDNGHGMDYLTIAEKWLVPSTDDKLQRKESPNGRKMQGKKGVGRYAAAILGEELLLNTVSQNRQKTSILLNWNDFEKAQYLNDVDVLVDTTDTTDSPYTEITITGDKEYLKTWLLTGETGKSLKITTLIKELRKLLVPIHKEDDDGDKFSIYLKYNRLDKDQKEEAIVEITPIDLVELYDYRIWGSFYKGNLNLTYESRKVAFQKEELSIVKNDLSGFNHLGLVEFDIRVYDRETEDIQSLINRMNSKYDNFGIREARRLLDEVNGIGVYRNGFRIRPLGDADFDWLKLNERRIQTPALRISSNQTIGFICIQDEQESGLIEKSARDGLKENSSYRSFVELSRIVINHLEQNRYIFRRKQGLGSTKTDRENINTLSSFADVKKDIEKIVDKKGLDESTKKSLIDVIEKDEKKKQKAAEELERKIAIYQGQATLGRIVSVILHESRRPLSYFVNQSDSINYWIEELKNNYEESMLTEIANLLSKFNEKAEILSVLFNKLDPIASGRAEKKKKESLVKIIESSFDIFEEKLISNKIRYDINNKEDFKINCWKSDMVAAFINLIDNSIYWLNFKGSNNKKICVDIQDAESSIVVDFRDNGEGIALNLIESNVIFEPDFSGKADGEGTGLGLAIAGEACKRNGAILQACYSEEGAHFQIIIEK